MLECVLFNDGNEIAGHTQLDQVGQSVEHALLQLSQIVVVQSQFDQIIQVAERPFPNRGDVVRRQVQQLHFEVAIEHVPLDFRNLIVGQIQCLQLVQLGEGVIVETAYLIADQLHVLEAVQFAERVGRNVGHIGIGQTEFDQVR